MSLELRVYDNGDHTGLVWVPTDGQPIPGCRGFAIHRKSNGTDSYLHGFVGFSDSDKLDPANPWKFPLQRYMWWDYGVKPGDKVQYSVVPVIGPSKDKLSLDSGSATPFTDEMTITGQCTPKISAFFNKGIVAAQWVSRALAQAPPKSKIKDLVATAGNALRDSLSGLLRPRILSLLEEASQAGGKIYAALYELNDPELIPALVKLGKNCNLILGNGAFKDNTPAHNDENAAVRAQLRSKINLFDRIVKKGHFAHNKFVVFCDAANKPVKVLTGSTNWTTSGLCTQANNGIIIDDPAIAQDYFDAWTRLKTAGSNYTKDLVAGNSISKTLPVDGGTATPWFVVTSAAQDLDHARKLISAAQDGILFLFFNPGVFQQDAARMTLLQDILERHNAANKAEYNPNLYLCGVVNQEIAGLTNNAQKTARPVTLIQSGTAPQALGHEVLVPHNIKDQFGDWEKELLGASMVNVHSKVIVIDPFGARPVVMTGSHNLGLKASSENDDNLVIVEGNGPLAAAYAINIVATFQAYRWNAYVEAHRKDPKVWHGLEDTDQWQSGHLQGAPLSELKFWMGQTTTGSAPAVAAAAVGGGSMAVAPAAPAYSVKFVTAKSAGRKQAGVSGTKTAAPKKAATTKKAAAKKTTAKKAAAKKATAKKATAKKATAKKPTAKKTTARKKAALAKKTAAKKTPAKKSAAKKAPVKKAAPASKKSAAKKKR
jgi:phosphatidylserine/phosphatidylglycerophosphate/cardiolipin synthase-like enzyme